MLNFARTFWSNLKNKRKEIVLAVLYKSIKKRTRITYSFPFEEGQSRNWELEVVENREGEIRRRLAFFFVFRARRAVDFFRAGSFHQEIRPFFTFVSVLNTKIERILIMEHFSMVPQVWVESGPSDVPKTTPLSFFTKQSSLFACNLRVSSGGKFPVARRVEWVTHPLKTRHQLTPF